MPATSENGRAGALADLRRSHFEMRSEIESRLRDFESVRDSGTDESIFKELVFCLFTPQSKAKSCWSAVERVCDSDLLLRGSAEQISAHMSGVRFHHTKAQRVVEARKHLKGLKARLEGFHDPFKAREWLVTNVNGMSCKEASHFLRNIGMGRDLAILDRHILKNLALLGVIDEIPRHLSPGKYLEIETRVRKFCALEKIPMDHLDILLWCRETGEIFK